MQVFVNKNALADTIDPVPVLGSFPDTPALDIGLYGGTATLLTVPTGDVDNTTTPPTLVSSFRNDMAIMVNAEANRRILLAFTDAMQRNANADLNHSITTYTHDTTTWPADAAGRKAEGDRGWTYVAQVRQASDALSNNLSVIDPTADSHWPAAITPVYVPPVVP